MYLSPRYTMGKVLSQLTLCDHVGYGGLAMNPPQVAAAVVARDQLPKLAWKGKKDADRTDTSLSISCVLTGH